MGNDYVKVGKHAIFSNADIAKFKTSNESVSHVYIDDRISHFNKQGIPVNKEMLDSIDIENKQLLRNTMEPQTGLRLFNQLVWAANSPTLEDFF